MIRVRETIAMFLNRYCPFDIPGIQMSMGLGLMKTPDCGGVFILIDHGGGSDDFDDGMGVDYKKLQELIDSGAIITEGGEIEMPDDEPDFNPLLDVAEFVPAYEDDMMVKDLQWGKLTSLARFVRPTIVGTRYASLRT